MWCILLFMCLLIININCSLFISKSTFPNYEQIPWRSMSKADAITNCSIQSPTTPGSQLDHHKDGDTFEENDVHSRPMIDIEVVFTLPFSVSLESILNQTVLVTDTIDNQIIPSIIHICINQSSVFISYSTDRLLPHNICLNLLLNTTTFKEIFFCQMINHNASSTDHGPSADHSTGTSAIFIISQSVIIAIMMFIISMVHHFRDKHVVSRVGRYLFRLKPDARGSSTTIPDHTYTLTLPNENHLTSSPIEELVLSANDLTTTRNDRRFTNHSLIDIKEFTKRMSGTIQDIELSLL